MQTRQYWMPDQGALLDSSSGGAPLRLDSATISSLCQANTYGIPVAWFVSIIARETNGAWNEVDTDYDAAGNPRALKTYGLCQLNAEEFAKALSPLAVASIAAGSPDSACDPATNVAAFARIMNQNLASIDAACTAAGSTPGDYDRFAYLAWSHNFGLPTVLKSIANYGCDWNACKARNGYGSGGIGSYATNAADVAVTDDTTGDSGIDSGNGAEDLDDFSVASGDDSGQSASSDSTTGVSSDSSLLRVCVFVAASWLLWDVFLA